MRKLMILATAIAALAVVALPASASAAEWTMNEEPLTENGTVTITGAASFSGGTDCHVHAHGILTPGTDTGHITSFIATECVPTETLASVCSEVTSVETSASEEAPWDATIEGTKIKFSGIHITNHYSGGLFCPGTITIEDDTAEGGGVFLTPNNTEHMETGTLSGTVETSFGTETVEGEGELTEGSGTYGL